MIDRSLGPYRVIEKLGEGGMGEVYRARDGRLNRDVAIKVLPGIFANDAERLIRFEREAKTLASLNQTSCSTGGMWSTPASGATGNSEAP